MKKIFFLAITFAWLNNSYSQSTEKWSLRKCVDYAMKNNISVKQADVQARIAALQLKQAKLYQLPSASFSTNIGPSFGRSLDISTNGYTNLASLSQNYNLQGGIEIFGWGKLKNSTAAAEFNLKAALSDIEKTANDVALSVATYYLQILSANQQINITKVQIEQTRNNLDATRKRVDAGALPELNALEFESQLAADSTSFVVAVTNYNQSLLSMKGLLNLDVEKAFEVDIPNVESIPLDNLADLQPESVYILALNNQPNIKSNRFRIKSGEKNILVAKSGLYPSITGSYALSTGYIDYLTNTGFSKTAYFTQLNTNFRQNLGVGISVPIFNNGTNRINYEQSKVNLQNTKVNEEQIEQKLKLDIYTSYSNAVSALQKFNASKKQVEVAQKAFDFATKRYDVGLLNTLDLITNQNNLLKAKTQNLADQYDYIFKMKLLEFYKGQGLKL